MGNRKCKIRWYREKYLNHVKMLFIISMGDKIQIIFENPLGRRSFGYQSFGFYLLQAMILFVGWLFEHSAGADLKSVYFVGICTWVLKSALFNYKHMFIILLFYFTQYASRNQ